MAVDTQSTLAQMDDLAVLVLFSVFESQVRERLAGEAAGSLLEGNRVSTHGAQPDKAK